MKLNTYWCDIEEGFLFSQKIGSFLIEGYEEDNVCYLCWIVSDKKGSGLLNNLIQTLLSSYEAVAFVNVVNEKLKTHLLLTYHKVCSIDIDDTITIKNNQHEIRYY